MRITMAAPFGLRPKGTTRWRALPLARALASRGHMVRVLIPSWDSPGDAGRSWREDGVHVVSIPFPARMGKVAWPILLVRLLRETMRDAPDIVHAFKPIGFSGAVARALLWLPRHKRPAVWADADDYEAEWARGRSQWQQKCIAWLERWVLSRADGVTVASGALAELVARWRPDTPSYIPNTSSLQAAEGSGVPGQVVWYTRFLDCPPDRVAGIWAAAANADLGPAPTLHVVGAGLRGEERGFRNAFAARGLSETVRFCGWLDGPALARELSSACLAMLPFADTAVNRYKCPARMADLTALGIPVVAHSVGECQSYVADGQTGLLAPPEDDTVFAGGIARLLSDGDARTRMRMQARARFEQHFAPDVLALQMERAYNRTQHGSKQ